MNNWYRFILSGLQREHILKLLRYFEEYDDVFKKGREFLKQKFNFRKDTIEKIYDSRSVDLELELGRLKALNVELLFIRDKNYPEKFLNIDSPPVFLHYKGRLELAEKSIAVIGTRKMTVYGRNITEFFVRNLVENNISIISGLALGVDVVAHETALKSGGNTIAVVGTGLDVIYPAQNSKIWEKIEKNGLIISEYRLGTPAFKWNFPERNRLVAALSDGVLLCESYERGGALITCEMALDYGKEVFAAPGYIFYPSFAGNNNLIKDCRAKLVSSVEDIISEFNWKSVEKVENLNFSKQELALYKRLNVEKTLDELILETKLKSSEILTVITEMEIKGLVRSIPGGRYIRAK